MTTALAFGPGSFRIPFVPRERDEEILHWLQLQDEGCSVRQIARLYNTGPGAVAKLLKRIRVEDAEAHGEVVA